MNQISETMRARVWVVDDSKAHAEVARRSLDARYDVDVLHDGASALERLREASPDVLVLDWYMPDLSGLEVCRFVRKTRDPSQLPILILTGVSDANDLVEAFEAGANDFLRKPFEESELNARVATLDHSRQLYARLNAAESRLRDEARFRERFIAVLGHDLRQPLSAITAIAQAMVRADAGNFRAERIITASQRMARMIDDVLDLSKSRLAGGIALVRGPASMSTIAARVVEELRSAHPQRLIDTHLDENALGDWDVDRLSQVCSNLFGNAIRHGANDSPVRVSVKGEPDRVLMTVQNRGTPIPPGSLATLFDAFRQGDRAVSSGGGLGLGLFIADQIVQAHGGSITVTSDERATKFCVELPRRSAKPEAHSSLSER